ncbi:MAG: rhomboid family intramembrane serine protease [Acidobacteria bacterium]|nr:MAG: rhomboid family intramembrane serine protease [Acidobacteriota bacterium]
MLPIQDTVPRRNPPLVTYALIAVNVLAFLVESSLPPPALERLFYLFGVVPARFTHPEWAAWVGFPIDNYWPFVTSMFLHGGLFHLFGNMWTLWIFGDNVEDRMGRWRFLAFYLLCGIAAGVVHWLTNPSSTVPTVGASGAIAGVLGAYFFLFPFARIILLVPVFFLPFFFEMPAFTYLLFWFLTQVLSGALALAGPEAVGGIAWWAHVGGFVAGVLLYRFFLRPPAAYRKHQLDELGPEGAWYVYRY